MCQEGFGVQRPGTADSLDSLHGSKQMMRLGLGIALGELWHTNVPLSLSVKRISGSVVPQCTVLRGVRIVTAVSLPEISTGLSIGAYRARFWRLAPHDAVAQMASRQLVCLKKRKQ